MAHFAEIDSTNIVIRVIVVDNNELLLDGVESEKKGIEFCQSLYRGNWVQTSYSGRIRFNYAGIGYTYDPIDDAFIAPKPFDSWILDNFKQWKSSVDYPQDGKDYLWNEQLGHWVATEAL